ncbi:DUF3016 domain-containing protein [Shewanella sp. 202IG2-18]|uniref:DUF3016 domain-containing protein n=1 Tax=Parashewanella hymeniacidonis TaxID=2807618 RepID=UPI00195F3438|nr:DUF3016 domain-containing protein [Parashewanella hymeniacidonis]MBM7073240.1 DUF3016 domain-containing protein [Parashewanella hymeniacidonis]
MNKLVLGLVALLFTGAASAHDAKKDETVNIENGSVSVIWQSPDHYRDIKSSGELQSRFQARLFKDLTKSLSKEAKKVLKSKQKLQMIVTDVDLAGDVRPSFGAGASDLRVVKDVYPPRFKFTYKVTQEGKVLATGKENISDLGFLDRIQPAFDRPFKYETHLLNSWMDKMAKTKLK